jgi:hypothetical protein
MQPVTSQPQTVMLGNQIVKVHSLNQIQSKVNSQAGTSETSTQEGQRPIILGSAIKLMKVSHFWVLLHRCYVVFV